MSRPTITQHPAEVYSIRYPDSYNWGDITIRETGPESISVMANSDFGHYAYHWGHCGMPGKKFLCGIDRSYAMQKLAGNGEIEQPDEKGWEREIKEKIIQARRAGRAQMDEARDAWQTLLGILWEYGAGPVAQTYMWDSPHFDWVFGDTDGLPSAKRLHPSVQGFWDHVWLPFTDQLRRELGLGEKAA